MTVWLVRHGRTAWNANGRLLGWSNEPLDEVGRTQAIDLRASLVGARFDGVWSSDLSRAIETARLAHSDPVKDPRLREIDLGDIEGMQWDATDFRIREEFADLESFQAPGGESIEQVRLRITEFFDQLGEGSHLVFSHAGVVRLVSRMCGSEIFPRPCEIIVINWAARRREA